VASCVPLKNSSEGSPSRWVAMRSGLVIYLIRRFGSFLIHKKGSPKDPKRKLFLIFLKTLVEQAGRDGRGSFSRRTYVHAAPSFSSIRRTNSFTSSVVGAVVGGAPRPCSMPPKESMARIRTRSSRSIFSNRASQLSCEFGRGKRGSVGGDETTGG